MKQIRRRQLIVGSISSIRLYIPLVNLTSISSSASQALLTPWHSLLQHQQIVPLKYHYYCVSKLRYVVSSPYRSDDKKTIQNYLKITIKLVILIRVMPHIPGAFVDISLVSSLLRNSSRKYSLPGSWCHIPGIYRQWSRTLGNDFVKQCPR